MKRQKEATMTGRTLSDLSGELQARREAKEKKDRAWEQRMLQHRHNSILGSIVLARQTLAKLPDEPSLSNKAVELARKIYELVHQDLKELEDEVYTYRRNIDGKVTKISHEQKGRRGPFIKPKIRRGKGSY